MRARGAGSLVREGLCGQRLPYRTLDQDGDCLQQHLGLALPSPDIPGKGRREGRRAHVARPVPVLLLPSQAPSFGPFLPTRAGQPTFSRALRMLVHSGLRAPS